jgi:hypothetical protein
VLFVDGTFCKPIKAAYDFATDKAVNFDSFAPALSASIIKEYAVTAEELREWDGDVLRWVVAPQSIQRAHNEFHRRNP